MHGSNTDYAQKVSSKYLYNFVIIIKTFGYPLAVDAVIKSKSKKFGLKDFRCSTTRRTISRKRLKGRSGMV